MLSASEEATGGVRWKRLGDMLLDAGLITRGQLDEGLAEKDRQKCFLGQALVRLGYISQSELISFLVKQCKIPHINLVDYQIDPRIVQLLPNDLCLQYKLIPIDNLGNILTIAMVNPLDIEALEHARAACPTLKLKPILCTPEHFELVAGRLLLAEDAKPGAAEAETLSLSSFGLRPDKPVAKAPAPSSAVSAPAEAPAAPASEPAAPRDRMLDADEYTLLVREILGELLNVLQGPAKGDNGPFASVFRDDLQFSFTLSTTGEPCYVSTGVSKVTGYDPEQFKARFLDLLTDHPGNPVLRRAITLSCAGQQHAPVEAEITSATGVDMMLHVALIPVFDSGQNLVAVQGVARDITRRERAEEQVFQAANHDPLTGLLNRRSFMARLNDVVQLAKRHQSPVSVGVINLDGFTQLNQAFGHAEGDRILVEVGQLLRRSLRGEDSIARAGSDEFYVLMPQVAPAEAGNGLVRCQEALAASQFEAADGRPMPITLTAALVTLGEMDAEPLQLVEAARGRVHAGKEAGGNRVVAGDGAS